MYVTNLPHIMIRFLASKIEEMTAEIAPDEVLYFKGICTTMVFPNFKHCNEDELEKKMV
jgi:hypothetical protein